MTVNGHYRPSSVHSHTPHRTPPYTPLPLYPPQTISVVVGGVTYGLSLHVGSAAAGTYSTDMAAPASAGCVQYYFTTLNAGGEGCKGFIGGARGGVDGSC
jgi:hypothetical protein